MKERFRPPILFRILALLLIATGALGLLAQILGHAGVEPFAARAAVTRLVMSAALLYGAIQLWRGEREGLKDALWWLGFLTVATAFLAIRQLARGEPGRGLPLAAVCAVIAFAYLVWCHRNWERFWRVPASAREVMEWPEDRRGAP